MSTQSKKFKQLIFAVSSAMIVLMISLVVLRLNVQAGFVASGAGGVRHIH